MPERGFILQLNFFQACGSWSLATVTEALVLQVFTTPLCQYFHCTSYPLCSSKIFAMPFFVFYRLPLLLCFNVSCLSLDYNVYTIHSQMESVHSPLPLQITKREQRQKFPEIFLHLPHSCMILVHWLPLLPLQGSCHTDLLSSYPWKSVNSKSSTNWEVWHLDHSTFILLPSLLCKCRNADAPLNILSSIPASPHLYSVTTSTLSLTETLSHQEHQSYQMEKMSSRDQMKAIVSIVNIVLYTWSLRQPLNDLIKIMQEMIIIWDAGYIH